MKAKTIKMVLRKKIDAWTDTIEDERVRELAKKNAIVTGGCIASMLLKEPINDIDVYFRDHETTLKVARYYVDKFKEKHPLMNIKLVADVEEDATVGRIKIVVRSAGVANEEDPGGYEYFEQAPNPEAGDAEEYVQAAMEIAKDSVDEKKPLFRPVFLSANAITLSQGIQLVIRFYGEPDEIHENYDFVHCTNYWTSWDSKLELKPKALEALLARELRYVGSRYPLCSIIRSRKFIQRGWHINAGQYLKMLLQINKLDLLDYKVLEDQLTGVDTAYFLQVIQLLKDKDPEKIEYAYLIEIIDRMF